jgi:glycerophosphoryl diester phosphodiesterase
MNTPLVIAHRGAAEGQLENSLESFEAAIALGADMLELDVRMTRDGELIVFHDEAVGGELVDGLTRAEMAQRTGRLPALLDQVVQLARGRVMLDVELKEPGYVAFVLDTIGTRLDPSELVITSFLDGVVADVKRLHPELTAGLLLGIGKPRRYVSTRMSELAPVDRAQRCGADYLAPHQALARLGVLRRAAAAGLPTLVWTVNSDRAIREFLSDGRVAGVITDVPGRALALRRQVNGAARR